MTTQLLDFPKTVGDGPGQLVRCPVGIFLCILGPFIRE
jgi:hypothetical protein